MEFMNGVARKEVLEITDILSGDYEGKTVKMNGAVHTIRDMGEVALSSLENKMAWY
jgi:nondiscriminating aspartyl-tRNA synthetase